ncbi:MAG TPA: hypothetical protein VKG25_28420 [Bryobacteraceae bacterium]|nr:hypothetical protein [Bryobacteraceae bacterium]
MAKTKTKLKAKAGKAEAVHLQGKKHQAVAIWNLSVLIVPDGESWFAQGLEINYGAQGSTPEDAQENFQQGLLATVRLHLKVHKNIERILKFAPSSILKEAAQNKSSIKQFAQVSFHEILAENECDVQLAIPFDGINYRVLKAAA